GQCVDAPHAHPGGVARAQREAARLVLRAPRFHETEIAAEGRGRRDRPDSLQLREAEPQALERPVEAALLDKRLAEERPAERLRRRLHRDVLRPEQDLDAPRLAYRRRPRAQG